jgi:predicted transcriptional regulator
MTRCTDDDRTTTRNGDRTSIDVAMEVLGTWQRRALLAELFDGGTATVDELVEALAAKRPREVGRRGDLRLRLLHADLPKLAAAGIVRFDRDDATVALAGEQRRVRYLLDGIPRR